MAPYETLAHGSTELAVENKSLQFSFLICRMRTLVGRNWAPAGVFQPAAEGASILTSNTSTVHTQWITIQNRI